MIEQFVLQLKEKQRQISLGAMQRPHPDYQLTAGQWQGLQMALEILDELLKEPEDQ